ncbi:MAG: ABC transporter ATP-binding protein [Acidimicrobiales bacterium]
MAVVTMLDAVSISKRFGGLVAIADVSLSVPVGRVTALIGPNGAGKTTLFNCLTGLVEPDQGTVVLDGHDITALTTHERCRRGVARTFQRLEVFSGMTVYENLQVAAEAIHPQGTFRGVVRLRPRPEPDVDAVVEATLARLGLEAVAGRSAGDLPTGVLRLVELGRALCCEPRVLLLDELASGLDESETQTVARLLVELAGAGLAILLIEHDVEMVMRVSDHVYVLDFGRVLAAGPPGEIARDRAVREAYLGTAATGTGS